MKNASSMKKLMEYAGGYRYLTYAAYLLSAVSALVALVPFYFIWDMIRNVLIAPDIHQAEGLGQDGYLAVAFAVLSMLIYIAALWCSHLSAFRVQRNIRIKLMEHILTLPVGFLDQWGSGKVRKVVTDCSAATETYLAHIWPDKAGMVFTPIGLIVLLLVFDWHLGLLCLVPVGIAFIFMTGMMGSGMQEAMKQYQNALETMSAEAVEYVRGIPVVKTFGQSVFRFQRFKQAIDAYSEWTIAYTKSMENPMLGFTTAINAAFALIIAFGIFMSRKGTTPELLLNLIFYIIITPVITMTLNKVMYAGENEMLVTDSLNRMEEILQIQPLPVPGKNSRCTAGGSPVCGAAKQPADSGITLEHVSYAYAEKKTRAVDDVSLNILSGQHVALVGPSGSGKSTIANLIARFFDVQEGAVCIGGVDVREIEPKDLMNTVAVVFQNAKLLKMSILENIRLARPEASREEVLQALHDAQCDDILEKLPEGVDTVIGANGVYVSGGEQQRLNIARVMLKNAPVLILDEATAFADPDNEVRVQAAFEKMSQGKTVIMIAHRLSTITSADQIYVVKDGRIVEHGTHQELNAQEASLYGRMWKEYQSAAEWKVGEQA